MLLHLVFTQTSHLKIHLQGDAFISPQQRHLWEQKGRMFQRQIKAEKGTSSAGGDFYLSN